MFKKKPGKFSFHFLFGAWCRSYASTAIVAITLPKEKVPGYYHFHISVLFKVVLNFQGKPPLDGIFVMCPAQSSASLCASLWYGIIINSMQYQCWDHLWMQFPCFPCCRVKSSFSLAATSSSQIDLPPCSSSMGSVKGSFSHCLKSPWRALADIKL